MNVLRGARTTRGADDRGAALVEFAFLLPIFLLLVVGIIEFGRVFNVQISLTGAAREGARIMAIHDDAAAAEAATITAASLPSDQDPQVIVDSSACGSGDVANQLVTVTVSRDESINIPFFGGPTVSLEGKGVMRCGG